MDYDALIFDMDGTLVNNVEVITKAWNQIFNQNNWKETVTNELIQSCMGLNSHDIGVKIFPSIDESIATKRIEQCGVEELEYLKIEMGSSYIDKKTLEILSRRYKLFIVSNCMQGYIEEYLKRYQFEPHFTSTLNASNGKTKSENIKYLVEKYNLKNPVYIGDTIKDYEAAKQANVKFVHAAYGFGKVDCPNKINNIKDLVIKK